jgi:predicted NUDIX family NTP pyrophosphohydrolase
MFRRRGTGLEVLLVHPGGPFYARKDLGAWSVPKGEYTEDEDPLAAARREFEEETGFAAAGEFFPLHEIRQAGGKIVKAWAVEGDCDASLARSNTFSMEWPPKSGKMREFPEVDRAEWFPLDIARAKLLSAQVGFLDQLVDLWPASSFTVSNVSASAAVLSVRYLLTRAKRRAKPLS